MTWAQSALLGAAAEKMDYRVPGMPTGQAWKPRRQAGAGCRPGAEPQVDLWCSDLGVIIHVTARAQGGMCISWSVRQHAGILLTQVMQAQTHF